MEITGHNCKLRVKAVKNTLFNSINDSDFAHLNFSLY
jgi:hypothetical protein